MTMRICSLLPGATEVVAALGLTDELVGISHECDYPEAVRGAAVLVHAGVSPEQPSAQIDRQVRETVAAGKRLYALDEAKFTALQPDLVITQDLCHVCAVTPDQLQRAIAASPRPPRLLALNPTRLEDVLGDVERIGEAAGRAAEGRALAAALRERLKTVRQRADAAIAADGRPTVACLEWLDPLYAGGHWVPEMVEAAGGRDALGTAGSPSEQIAWDRLVAAAPEIIVLMPCGFSIARTRREVSLLTAHPLWQELAAVRAGRVFVVDAGAYFSRPGPRLVDGVEILAAMSHPAAFGNRLPDGVEQVRNGR